MVLIKSTIYLLRFNISAARLEYLHLKHALRIPFKIERAKLDSG